MRNDQEKTTETFTFSSISPSPFVKKDFTQIVTLITSSRVCFFHSVISVAFSTTPLVLATRSAISLFTHADGPTDRHDLLYVVVNCSFPVLLQRLDFRCRKIHSDVFTGVLASLLCVCPSVRPSVCHTSVEFLINRLN